MSVGIGLSATLYKGKKSKKYSLCLLVYLFACCKFSILSYVGDYPSIFPPVFGSIDNLLEVLAALLSLYVLLRYSARVVFDRKLLPLLAMTFFVALSLTYASCLGKAVDLKYVIRSFEYLAFAIYLHVCWEKDHKKLVNTCLLYFGFVGLCDILSILLTEFDGFVPGQSSGGRLFLFGGKNSLFAPGVSFIFCAVAYDIVNHNKAGGLIALAASVVFALSALMINSASSVFFFLLIMATLVFWLLVDINNLRLTRGVCLIVLLVLLAIVFSGGVFEAGLRSLLELFNRDSTFTGRVNMWQDALSQIAASPLFGTGATQVFVLSYWSTSVHAHSYFLTVFAQFGVLCFSSFIFDVLIVSKQVADSRFQSSDVLLTMLFILLFHSVFDDLNFFYYIFLSRLTLCVAVKRVSLFRNTGVTDCFHARLQVMGSDRSREIGTAHAR